MTKQELKAAITLAKERSGIDFAETNLHVFNGFALKSFQAIRVSLKDVADLIRWQAIQFNGDLDIDSINEIALIGRSKFLIVG